MSDAHARAWLDAAQSTHITRVLSDIYQSVANEITRRNPACWGSGRCCNFAKVGHDLFVTGLEAAHTYLRAPRAITLEDINAARLRGDCPWLVQSACTVHTVKPLGCRIYFCDRTSFAWQGPATEAAMRELRTLHDRFDIPYEYAEWRSLLKRVALERSADEASATSPAR